MYQKMMYSKEARSKVFRDLKARRKVRIKHFKFKMTRVCGYKGNHQLALEFKMFASTCMGYKRTNNVMILYLEVKQHARKSNQNVKRV